MSGRPKHVCFYSKKCPYSKAFLEDLARTPYTTEFQFICVDPSPNRPKLPTWLKSVPTLIIDGEAEPMTDEKVFNWLSQRRIQGNTPASNQQYKNFIEPPPPAMSSNRDAPRYDANQNTGPQQSAASDERMMPTTMPRYDPGYSERPTPQRGGFPEPIQTRTTSGQQQAQQQAQQAQSGAPDADGPAAYHMAEMAGGSKWSDSYSFLDDQFSIEKGTGVSRIERNFATLNGGPDSGAPQQSAKPEHQTEKAKALNSAYDNYMKQREIDMPNPLARR